MIKDKVKQVMSAVFEINPAAINDEASPESIHEWDSLRHMNLIVALEEEFEVQFDDEEILELLSLKRILLNLQKKIH